MLQEQKIDYIGSLDKWQEETNFMVPTSSCASESFTLSMFLKPPAARNENSLSFLEHSKLILIFILGGFLIATLFIFVFQLADQSADRKRPTVLRRSILAVLNYYQNCSRRLGSPSKVNCVMVTFLLFWMIMYNTLTSNTNSNRVILNTSELIDSRSKLDRTRRWACWLTMDQAANNLILNGDKAQGLAQILDRKRMPPDNRVCNLNEESEDHFLYKIPPDEMFFVMLKSSLHIFMSFFYRFVEGRYVNRFVLFEANQLIDFELGRVPYLSSSLENSLKHRVLSK